MLTTIQSVRYTRDVYSRPSRVIGTCLQLRGTKELIRIRLVNSYNENTSAREGLPKIDANIFEKSRREQVDSVLK